MGRSSRRLFALVCLTAAPLLAQVGCTQSEGGAFECLNDGDCPPECPCDNNPPLGDLVGACESTETRRDCGGSCDAETQCSAGTSCVFDRTDGEVDFYSCKGDGTGGAGGMAGTGGTGGSGGVAVGDCAFAAFDLSPSPGSPRTITREVCFHSKSELGMNDGECPVYNFAMPPDTTFSDFVDIFYGGTQCDDEFLSEFTEGGDTYLFFGEPTRSPAESGTGPLATGEYNIVGGPESGTFEYHWPSSRTP